MAVYDDYVKNKDGDEAAPATNGEVAQEETTSA